MLKKTLLPGITIFCLATGIANASPYGLGLGYVVINKDPNHLHAYRASFLYEPSTWTWGHAHIFIDTSFGHWWVDNQSFYHALNIYSIAPVLRYFFKEYPLFTPFIDLSIGPSYLSRTHIADRNLGMHFAFQDQAGFGFAIGREKKLSISASILHYSNGSMSSMNAGISVPLMLNVSYRF